MPFEFHGGLLVKLETKKNHITDLKSALKMVFIGMLFHAVSFHVNIVFQNVKNVVSVFENHVNYLNW